MKDTHTLRIERAVYSGSGLARLGDGDHAGKTVFVPLTLPGEVVEAHVTATKRSFDDGELISVLEPAPERTQPPCKHFGLCGGCQYQHATYVAQLAMKRSILIETMQRANIRTLPEITVHSGAPLAYRNRIRLHVTTTADGLRLGYKQRRSNAVLPINECPIAAPLLIHTAQALLAHQEMLSSITEAELFCDAEEKALQLSLILREGAPQPDLASAMNALKANIPQLLGAGLYAHETLLELSQWGNDTLLCTIRGVSYRVTRGAFFQVHRELAATLVNLVVDDRSGALAWDLYAGVGLFSVALAASFERVIGVEAAKPSVQDLAHNLALAGPQHRALENTTLDFLRRTAQPSSKKPPALIVLDPPRAGLGSEVCGLLAIVAAPELVYVSCDPVTLSRDLAALIESGYTLQQMHLVDLFPQTFHMETVAVLARPRL